MRVLIAENDPVGSRVLSMMMEHEGIQSDTTVMGADVVSMSKTCDYDLIILNPNLSGVSGFSALKNLRDSKDATPVLLLSDDDSTESKVKGFGLGADDYLTKPYAREELIARIQAIVRRSKGHASHIITTGKLSVNLDQKTVTFDGKPLLLTRKEYDMIELLSLRKGVTLTKDMFLDHLYNGIDEPEPKIIDVFICKIRKKIAEFSDGEDYIETVWGRGYVMRDSQ